MVIVLLLMGKVVIRFIRLIRCTKSLLLLYMIQPQIVMMFGMCLVMGVLAFYMVMEELLPMRQVTCLTHCYKKDWWRCHVISIKTVSKQPCL
jgi:hypothetical protein